MGLREQDDGIAWQAGALVRAGEGDLAADDGLHALAGAVLGKFQCAEQVAGIGDGNGGHGVVTREGGDFFGFYRAFAEGIGGSGLGDGRRGRAWGEFRVVAGRVSALIGKNDTISLYRRTRSQAAMGTTQAVIARLESGRAKPSTRTLERFAKATHSTLRISFEPEKTKREAA